MAADLAILEAWVRTLDPERPFTHAVAMKDGVIVALGDDVRAACDGKTEVIDARGAALIPGLVDSHMHPFWGAELARGVDLRACRTPADTLVALRAGKPQRGWLFGWGLDYDAAPTPAEIADALPRRGGGGADDGPAHRARHAHRAALGAGDRARGVPGQLHGRGGRGRRADGRVARGRRAGPRAARRAAHALAGAARPARRDLGRAQRAGADRGARDGRRPGHARAAARPRRHRRAVDAPARSRSGSRPSWTTRRSRSGSSCATRAGSCGAAAWPSSSPTA